MAKINGYIEKAQRYCEANGLRFTAPRRYVLEILHQHQKPMGAYEVLEKLHDYIDSPKPPTAYRAIEFWRDHGFVHKVESLNAFITCCEGHAHKDTHFLVCGDCHKVEEIHHSALNTDNIPDGFKVTQTWVETHGICATCSK